MHEGAPCEIVGLRSDGKEVILSRRVGGEVWWEVWKVEDLELSLRRDLYLSLRDKNGLYVPCENTMAIRICPFSDPHATDDRQVLVEMPFPEEPTPEIFLLYSNGDIVVRHGPKLNKTFHASGSWYSYRPADQKIVFPRVPALDYGTKHWPPFECLDVPEAILRKLGSGEMVLNVV